LKGRKRGKRQKNGGRKMGRAEERLSCKMSAKFETPHERVAQVVRACSAD